MTGSAALMAALLVVPVLAGCSREASSDRGASPRLSLPTSIAAAEELVRSETRRPVTDRPDLDARAIVAAVDGSPGSVVVGDAAITRWIEERLARALGPAYVLLGAWHDAPGQIDAFRRLVGPGGVRGLEVVAVELLRSDGAWSGAPAVVQRGDTEALDAYQRTGDRDAFAKLRRDQRDANYVAWKLGFEAVTLDLATTAHATGVPLRGCDMPSALQALTTLPHGELLHRLREIHCVRTLSTPEAPHRAALLWGDAHLRPDGLQRFLPASATVLSVHLLGQRIEPGAIETALAKELSITDPVLVPIRADEAALLLPDATLSARIDRVLSTRPAGESIAMPLSVRGNGTLTIDGRALVLSGDAKGVSLSPGDHTYAFARSGRRVLGGVHIEPGHDVEIGFEADGSVSYLERHP